MEEDFRIALGLKSGNAVPTNGKIMRRGSPCGCPRVYKVLGVSKTRVATRAAPTVLKSRLQLIDNAIAPTNQIKFIGIIGDGFRTTEH